MSRRNFKDLDIGQLQTPCYVVDEVAVERNLALLKRVADDSGARILLSLKAFSMSRLAPLVSEYLSGTSASSLYEARFARENFGGELHVYSPAYSDKDFGGILGLADTLVFNSFSQWERFRTPAMQARQERPGLRFGLRINPEHSEGTAPVYDPCVPGSRLGVPTAEFSGHSMEGISGLHFHTLCEQGFEPLQRTLGTVEERFGEYLADVDWVNFGGGHLVTEEGYKTGELVQLIADFSRKYGVQVYLEPGAAVAFNVGVLVSEVLDVSRNELDQVIIDASAACHMPDVLEMPYRPDILGAGEGDGFDHEYRVGGQSCLAGDVIGDYRFKSSIRRGDRLVLTDMAHYTMVKTTTFNGIALPAIYLWNSDTDALELVRAPTYEDFRSRLS